MSKLKLRYKFCIVLVYFYDNVKVLAIDCSRFVGNLTC